jgi:peroxiredoxin
MPALNTGVQAPDFTLEGMDGKKFSLSEALKHGPVLAIFFKISCPVCQFALPYFERLYKSYEKRGVTVVGISQDSKKDTAEFIREYGITFPVVLDEKPTYPVSNAYGLTNVPTIFWIASDGEIELSSVGWSRQDIEQINTKLAEAASTNVTPLFRPGEDVPDFRAG